MLDPRRHTGGKSVEAEIGGHLCPRQPERFTHAGWVPWRLEFRRPADNAAGREGGRWRRVLDATRSACPAPRSAETRRGDHLAGADTLAHGPGQEGHPHPVGAPRLRACGELRIGHRLSRAAEAFERGAAAGLDQDEDIGLAERAADDQAAVEGSDARQVLDIEPRVSGSIANKRAADSLPSGAACAMACRRGIAASGGRATAPTSPAGWAPEGVQRLAGQVVCRAELLAEPLPQHRPWAADRRALRIDHAAASYGE